MCTKCRLAYRSDCPFPFDTLLFPSPWPPFFSSFLPIDSFFLLSRTDRPTTVDLQIHTGDELSLVTGQKGTNVGHVAGVRQPPQGDVEEELLHVLLVVRNADELFKQSRAGQKGTQGVDSDLILAEFRRQTFCRLLDTNAHTHRSAHAHTAASREEKLKKAYSGQKSRGKTHIGDRSFTGVVPDQTGPGSHGADARDVDDGPTAPALQGGHGGGDAQEDALDVDRHDPVVLLLRHLERGLVLVTRAGVVDEHVQAAKLFHRRLHHLVPVGLDRDVGGDGLDVLVVLRVGRVDLLESVAVHVGRHHLGPFLDELLGARQTES